MLRLERLRSFSALPYCTSWSIRSASSSRVSDNLHFRPIRRLLTCNLSPDGNERQSIKDMDGNLRRPKIRYCCISDPFVMILREDDTLGLFVGDAERGKIRRKDMTPMGEKVRCILFRHSISPLTVVLDFSLCCWMLFFGSTGFVQDTHLCNGRTNDKWSTGNFVS